MEKEGKSVKEVALDMPELESTMNSWLVPPFGRSDPKDILQVGHAVIRVLCLVSSVVCLSLMVTSEEEANISLYGIQFPVSSKWTFSDSFEYLVGVSAAVIAYSVLQLLICLCRFRTKASSRNFGWIVFAGDQVLAYAMMSAASASAGVANLNRTGIKHTALPNFCEPLHAFCSRVAASIVFAFFCGFLLATSSILDIICLSKSY
nr:CASP-like protein 3A1 [Fagopyrum tataricum]